MSLTFFREKKKKDKVAKQARLFLFFFKGYLFFVLTIKKLINISISFIDHINIADCSNKTTSQIHIRISSNQILFMNGLTAALVKL
jgi:hypothetical protein